MRFTRLMVSFALLLGASWSFAQTKTGDACLSIKAASPQSLTTMFFAAKKGAAVAADAEVQKCIEGKISGGALKDDGITSKVTHGEAVLEGKSSVSGHKGAATNIAKGCGAQKVTNNIIITRNPKPPKE